VTPFKRLVALSLLRSLITTFAFAVPAGAHADLGNGTASRLLTDDGIQAIHAGMKASEVLELIGVPLRKVRFERTATTAWDYRLKDSWGYRAEFSVIVDDNGIVVGRISVRQDP